MPTAQDRAQISAIARGITQQSERAVRKITLELHGDLVRSTPVDTGWARANWLPRVGRPAQSPAGSPGSVSSASAQSGVARVAAYTLAQGKVFVTNNVPYIERLNDGHSRQEPAGFVQRAIRKAVRSVIP